MLKAEGLQHLSISARYALRAPLVSISASKLFVVGRRAR
jgi:hypothetical protein